MRGVFTFLQLVTMARERLAWLAEAKGVPITRPATLTGFGMNTKIYYIAEHVAKWRTLTPYLLHLDEDDLIYFIRVCDAERIDYIKRATERQEEKSQ